MRMRFCSVLFFLMLLGWGCTSGPDMVSTQRAEGEKYSADEVRHVTVDQPFALSGDYFRERSQEPVKLGELLSRKGEQGKKQEVEKGKSVNSDPAPDTPIQPVAKAMPVSASSLPVKVGFILDHGNVTPNTAKQLLRSMPGVAKAFPAVMVDQEQIREALNVTDCLKNRDLLCVSGTVSLYPGVQMLVLVELFEVSQQVPGSVRARVVVVDTGLAFRYPPMEITAPIKNETDKDAAMAGVLHKVLDFVVQKGQVMPWFCRSFSSEKEYWYISAGEMSGLQLGDRLKVVSGGKLVKSPMGLPAGWIPGKQTGTLKVDLFFGKDFAACSVAEGKGPKPNDLILLR